MRLLWHTLHLAGDREVLEVLGALLPRAVYPMPPRASMHYDVRAVDGGWEVREEGDPLAREPSVQGASDAVYLRAHRRAFELASLAGWSRVHAATIDLGGMRLLVVGPSGAGKTTLAVRMLFDGEAVQGDESVLVHRTGVSLAVPRAFHVKDGTAAVVPELRALPRLPRIEDVAVLDPTVAGRPWVLAELPVDHVVLLERGGGATTGDPVPAIEPVPGAVVLQALVRQAFPVTEGKAELVRTLVGATASSAGHRITVGDLTATVSALRALVR